MSTAPFEDVAAVAPATVTAISEGKHDPPKRKRRKAKANPNGPVAKTVVNGEVWFKALELAGGDSLRLEVRGPTEVVVHNPGWRKP